MLKDFMPGLYSGSLNRPLLSFFIYSTRPPSSAERSFTVSFFRLTKINIAESQRLPHLVNHNATKGIHPFPHVSHARTKVVAHRVIKTEHDQELY